MIPPSEWNPRMKITLPEEEEPGVEEEAETQSLVEEASHSHTLLVTKAETYRNSPVI